MNSYGDVNADLGDPSSGGDDWLGTGGRASARASVSTSTMAASVPVAPAGRATVGGARASARVPGASQAAPPGAASGRATARVSVGGGRRPVGGGYGGPGGPGGPHTGSISRFIEQLGGSSNDPRARKRRRINIIVGAVSILGVLLGASVVGLTYYSTTVALPSDFNKLALTSTLHYGDGSEIAKIGSENRVYTKIDQIPPQVQRAVASAEDRKFFSHAGIDYVGIGRAAWNNITGGDQQGASTITQQYARNAMDLQADGYARKVKEAILASKLNDKFSKPEIMEFYLNTIYFGRGAYSIETAAQAYFGKSVGKLSIAESAVLAGVIKQPVPSETHKGFDPGLNPEAAQDRWRYVLAGMRENNWISPEEYSTAVAKYPVTKKIDSRACGVECGLSKPAGIILPYITRELSQMKDPKTGKALCTFGQCRDALASGGFRITTTLNPKMQAAAEAAAGWGSKPGDILRNEPKNLRAAMAAVSPETGQVLAYYGGPNDNTAATDYAGLNTRDNQPLYTADGKLNTRDGKLFGAQVPGSSFKVYTLAAALEAGYRADSRWKGRDRRDTDGRVINNAGRAASCGDSCTLRFSTTESYNVPFYGVAERIGPDKVVDMAKKAGIRAMASQEEDGFRVQEIANMEPSQYKGRSMFDNHIGFGKYPITVLDHANGMATFAARGVYNKAYFVQKVERKNPQTGKFETVGGARATPEQRIDQGVADDVTSILQGVPRRDGNTLFNYPSAGKTGTWELNENQSDQNGDAWMVGYTPQVAAAVWVGSDEKKRTAIKDRFGGNVFGAGTPAKIWKQFMNAAMQGKERREFLPPANVGNPDKKGDGNYPSPCVFPPFCGNGGNNNDGDDDFPSGGNFPFPTRPGIPTRPDDGTGGGNSDGGTDGDTGGAIPDTGGTVG
ncbi:bifunctional penicillin-binding protein 1A/1B [Pilimelia terevasa]|uniref:Bifunctional penicillin-binding protein 1A/1B n=1 Tax=Pilimelia terevasa TaxID=53372 RepID=A0A8J3FKL6_9ACTN|nr:transglycosylase domain-containing protein [Pilimelia terevasa]GGK41344.1 bifunctional penicillin-binding protein 1A/1B [Pilimelia terevasa]